LPGIFPSGHTSTVAAVGGVAVCAKVVPTRMRKARKRKIIGRKRVGWQAIGE
jgi:hypothetical protein